MKPIPKARPPMTSARYGPVNMTPVPKDCIRCRLCGKHRRVVSDLVGQYLSCPEVGVPCSSEADDSIGRRINVRPRKLAMLVNAVAATQAMPSSTFATSISISSSLFLQYGELRKLGTVLFYPNDIPTWLKQYLRGPAQILEVYVQNNNSRIYISQVLQKQFDLFLAVVSPKKVTIVTIGERKKRTDVLVVLRLPRAFEYMVTTVETQVVLPKAGIYLRRILLCKIGSLCF